MNNLLLQYGRGEHQEPLLAETHELHAAWAEAHKFRFVTSSEDLVPGMSPYWGKVALILREAKPDDFILYLDPDAVLLTNEDVSDLVIEDLGLVKVNDRWNTGVMFINWDSRCEKFFRSALAAGGKDDGVGLNAEIAKGGVIVQGLPEEYNTRHVTEKTKIAHFAGMDFWSKLHFVRQARLAFTNGRHGRH